MAMTDSLPEQKDFKQFNFQGFNIINNKEKNDDFQDLRVAKKEIIETFQEQALKSNGSIPIRRQEVQNLLDRELTSLAKLLHAVSAPVLKLELSVQMAVESGLGDSAMLKACFEQKQNSPTPTPAASDEHNLPQESPQRTRKRKSSMPVKFGASVRHDPAISSAIPNPISGNGNKELSRPQVLPQSAALESPTLQAAIVPGTSFVMLLEPSQWSNSLQSTSLALTPMTSPIKISGQSNSGHAPCINSNDSPVLSNYKLVNSSKSKLPLRPLRAAFPSAEPLRGTGNRQPVSVLEQHASANKTAIDMTMASRSGGAGGPPTKQRKISRRFICQQCQEVFHALNSLTKHTLAVHGRFRCSECKEAFTQKSNMERHFLKHQNFKPFRCGICNKAYYRKDHAARHVETSHIGFDSKLVVEKLDEHGNRHAAPSINSSRGVTPAPTAHSHASLELLDQPVVLTGEAAEAAAAAELAATAEAAAIAEAAATAEVMATAEAAATVEARVTAEAVATAEVTATAEAMARAEAVATVEAADREDGELLLVPSAANLVSDSKPTQI